MGELSAGVGVPVISALLLGLLASTAPCQISTSAGALPFILRRPGERRATSVAARSFIGGKVAVYTLTGVIFAALVGADLVRGVKRAGRAATVVAGVVLLLAGLNDTLVYWFL